MPDSVPGSQRLLVTGGRGRLASLLAEHFRPPAHAVLPASRTGGDGFLTLDQACTPAALAGQDVVLHLAWSSLPATAESATAEADLALTSRLLASLAAVAPDRRPHLVFFSSGGAVYGDAPDRPSRETDSCQPRGRYGAAKLAAEELIRTAAARDGLDCAILRISNPYGFPVPAGRAQGVIPHAVRCALEGTPLTLWGDGQARKDFLHCTDFLAALRAVLARRLTGTFNVATGESHSVREIVALVERHTGRSIRLQSTAAPAWDVRDSRLDVARFKNATGWQPQVSLDEGIRRSVAAVLGR